MSKFKIPEGKIVAEVVGATLSDGFPSRCVFIHKISTRFIMPIRFKSVSPRR